MTNPSTYDDLRWFLIHGRQMKVSLCEALSTLADFEFAMSGQDTDANNTPSTWQAAPAPIAFTVLADTPSVGTDRVEFIWGCHA